MTEGGSHNHLATATTAADETEADHATDHTEIESETARETETEMHIEEGIHQLTGEGEIGTEAGAENGILEVCSLHHAHMFIAYDLQISHLRTTTDHTVAHDLDRLFAMAMQPRPEDAPLLHRHERITIDHPLRNEHETGSSLNLLTRSPRSSPTRTRSQKPNQRSTAMQ